MKLSKKHKTILKKIVEKGYYRPTYSDQEPATKTLMKAGLIDWRGDYKGLELTDSGREYISKEETLRTL